MILSQPSRYGLRAVLHLAQHDPELLQVREIAESLELPQHFLAKILQDLSRRGLLHSTKGRGGGFRLARPAEKITLLEVVQTIEGPGFADGCILGMSECSGEHPCALHGKWAGLKEEVLSMLRDRTVLQLLDEAMPIL